MTVTRYDRLILYFDGAARSNPNGPAGAGWDLYEMDRHGTQAAWIKDGSIFLGWQVSNNQAEYQALASGLKYIKRNLICRGLYIRGDAEIVINQINGDYQVRSENIRPYYQKVMNLLESLEEDGDIDYYRATWIPRMKNTEADRLANHAIDCNT